MRCQRYEQCAERVSSIFFSSKPLRSLTIGFKSREVISVSSDSQLVLESFGRRSGVYGHPQAVIKKNSHLQFIIPIAIGSKASKAIHPKKKKIIDYI